MKNWAILLLAFLTGCASTPREAAPDLAPLFADAAFGPPTEPVDTANLFALSPEMRAHLRSPAFTAKLHWKGPDQGLVDALYEKGDLKIEYSTITRTAAQTYAARSGNCLSLVIMTAAFAKALGMPVRYQSVEVDDSWSRNGDLYLLSSHVNLSLGTRLSDKLRGKAESELTIDFLPPKDMGGYRTRPLEEDDIVAMYMNNRAAEALVDNRLDDAYWWARAAVQRQPRSSMPFNTLGVIYQRHGEMELAERALRAALEREPADIAAMQNLAPLLTAQGKAGEAQALAQRIARLAPDLPIDSFERGMRAFEAGDYRQARTLFARAVRRAPEYDEFHFWLALAYLRLGEDVQAREQLALARDTSTRPDTRERYSAKLAHLRTPGTATASMN